MKEAVEIKKKIEEKRDIQKEDRTKIVIAMYYSDGLI